MRLLIFLTEKGNYKCCVRCSVIYFTIDGSSQITSNPEPQFTLNVDLDDSVCEMELPIKTIYACLSVISLVAIASFALFIKHKTQEKIK